MEAAKRAISSLNAAISSSSMGPLRLASCSPARSSRQLARSDPLAGFGHDVDYRLTPLGNSFLTDFGVVLPRGRQAIRYCVDWSEQRHHLAGGLGRGLLDRLLAMDWIRRAPDDRAVRITDRGRDGLASTFALTPPG